MRRTPGRTPRSSPPTMSDVGRRVGVSAMTVSRALLRNDASIAPETRERIMRAVEEVGYVLDQSARSLVSRRTNFIAALIPSINNSNFADTTRAITEVLEPTGIQLLLGYTDYSSENEERLVEAMLRRRPEGMIVTGGRHTDRSRQASGAGQHSDHRDVGLPERPIEHVVGLLQRRGRRGALVRYLHEARLSQDRLYRRHLEPRRARRRAARWLRAAP